MKQLVLWFRHETATARRRIPRRRLGVTRILRASRRSPRRPRSRPPPRRCRSSPRWANFTIELNAERAPITVAQFLKYVDQGFYAGHDLSPRDSRISSSRAAATTSTTSSRAARQGRQRIGQRPDQSARHGGACAARRNLMPAMCQFYVNLADNAALDPSPTRWGYAVFGKVVQGMDVVDQISRADRRQGALQGGCAAEAGGHRENRARRTPRPDRRRACGVATLFISDLHIDAAAGRRSPRSSSISCDGEARGAEALYILGDLFESWVGRRCGGSRPKRGASTPCGADRGGVPCFVMHGNRDFLLGPELLRQRPGARAAAGPGHPDAVRRAGAGRCTAMRFAPTTAPISGCARTVRDADWQRRFLAPVRRGAPRAGGRGARTAAGRTRRRSSTRSPTSMPTASRRRCGPPARRRCCTATPIARAIHPLSVDGRACTRIVLGDWYTQGSVLRWDRAARSSIAAADAAARQAHARMKAKQRHRGR